MRLKFLAKRLTALKFRGLQFLKDMTIDVSQDEAIALLNAHADEFEIVKDFKVTANKKLAKTANFKSK